MTLLQLLAPALFTVLLILLDLLPRNPNYNPYNPFPQSTPRGSARRGLARWPLTDRAPLLSW